MYFTDISLSILSRDFTITTFTEYVRLVVKYNIRDNFHTLTKDQDWLKYQTNESFVLRSRKTPMHESVHEILISVIIKIKSIETSLSLRLITSKTTAELLEAMHCLFQI